MFGKPLSTKFKIILTIFGIVVIILIIQSAITFVNTEKKREHFENKNADSEEPNIKPKTASKDASEKTTDAKERAKETAASPEEKTPAPKPSKDVRITILETIDEVFDKYYPESDKKPILFDMLLSREHFENIKDKQEKGVDVKDAIVDLIKKQMNLIEMNTTGAVKDTFENSDVKEAPKAGATSSSSSSSSGFDNIHKSLDEIVAKLSEVQSELKKTTSSSTKATDEATSTSKAAAPSESASKDAVKETYVDYFESVGKNKQGASLSAKEGMFIDGFENKKNYAFL